MNDADPLRKVAAKIQQQTAALGVVSVVLDQERRVHTIPGAGCELIGIYEQGVSRAEVLEDLKFSGAVV